MRLVRGASRLKLGDVRARARGDRSRSGGASRTGTLPRPEPGRPGPGANGGGGRRRLVRIRGDGRDRERRFAHRRRRQRTRRRPRRTRGTRSRDDEERASVARHAPGRVRVRGARVADGDVESHVDGGGEPLLVSVRNLAPFAGKNALSRGSCERLCRLVERYASHALLFAQKKPDAYEDHVRTLAEATHALDACARARGETTRRSSRRFARRATCSSGSTRWAPRATRTKRTARVRKAPVPTSRRAPPTPPTPTPIDSDAPTGRTPRLSPRRRKPSREWMRAIRSRLSLDATLRLARQRSRRRRHPAAAAPAARKPRPFAPATVRRFTGASSEVRKWLRGYALGLVLLRETQAVEGDMSRTFAPLFDANRVRLFRVTRVRRRKD